MLRYESSDQHKLCSQYSPDESVDEDESVTPFSCGLDIANTAYPLQNPPWGCQFLYSRSGKVRLLVHWNMDHIVLTRRDLPQVRVLPLYQSLPSC